MNGGNIACTGVTATATTVNASCAIAAGAGLTARNVTLTDATNGNLVLTAAFTVVNPPVATLASIAPVSSTLAQRGTTVGVTLTGTNFTTGTTVAAPGGGITVSGVVVVNSTTITANFAISGSATGVGAHNVTVTNASTTASNAVTFTKN
jgi:hypothetical protein